MWNETDLLFRTCEQRREAPLSRRPFKTMRESPAGPRDRVWRRRSNRPRKLSGTFTASLDNLERGVLAAPTEGETSGTERFVREALR